jgi:mannose-6-phosphate isomerase-like protein (cupin superfamily)
MEIQVIDTFKDAEQVWIGLGEEGHRRKVWRAVNEARMGATKIVAGIAIFEPGERCAAHSHPGCEEINFAVKGGGIVIDTTHNKEKRFKEHDFLFIPEGVEHVHYNDGREPLLLLFAYAPPGQLPTK